MLYSEKYSTFTDNFILARYVQNMKFHKRNEKLINLRLKF